jgi:hypothetical protein
VSEQPAADDEGTEGAVPQADPEDIQREIEETRAELAASIDAIADRVSPRRAAARGATRVKAAVGAIRNHQAPAPVEVVSAPGAERPALPPATGHEQQPRWVLRTDRLVLAGGLAAVVVAVTVVYLVRHRRS